MEVEVGSVVEGKISGITNFGAFVELGEGTTGMVHISEVAQGFVKDIREHFSLGDTVKVKVLAKSPEGKISLSIKQAQEPAPRFEKRERQNSAPSFQKSDSFEFRGKQKDNMSFEDMMSSFKKSSDEKMYDLKKVIDNRRGSQNRRSHQQP
jgi:S1 RNA binding domain protein